MKFFFLVATVATATLCAPTTNDMQMQTAIEEMRIAIVDLQQTVAKQKMDIVLLEEKKSNDPFLLRRVSEVEKMQQGVADDLRELSEHANQSSAALGEYRQQIAALQKQMSRFEDLQGTLQSISKAINTGNKTHQVTSGDSLDRIARQYNTTVEALKQRNDLTSNTILIGQQLVIP